MTTDPTPQNIVFSPFAPDVALIVSQLLEESGKSTIEISGQKFEIEHLKDENMDPKDYPGAQFICQTKDNKKIVLKIVSSCFNPKREESLHNGIVQILDEIQEQSKKGFLDTNIEILTENMIIKKP